MLATQQRTDLLPNGCFQALGVQMPDATAKLA
jgi:hypothetical protein